MEIKRCLMIDSGNLSENYYFLFLSKLPFIECETCKSVDEALRYIYSRSGMDIVLINRSLDADILSDFLKKMSRSPPVIVISKSDKQALEAFEIDGVVDSISLPFKKSRLLRSLSRAWDLRHSENSVADLNSIFVKCGRIMKRFLFEGIEYVEAYGIYSKIYYQGFKVVVNENISNLEYLLGGKMFRRIHKSYIININNIQQIHTRTIQLKNKTEGVPFGPKYKPLVANLLNKYMP
jgi:DNA-binding LytR/AlgR family response regulator